MQEIKLITEALVSGKRVLLRTSLNVPLTEKGDVSDTFRLRSTLPTLEWLHTQGAKTVIIGHLGREGKSLGPVAEALQQLCPDIPIRFFKGSISEAVVQAHALQDGECLMLENIRSYEEEEQNDLSFAGALAGLGEIYVNDAFADSHRMHASIVSLPELLPSYAGLRMMEELGHVSQALNPPQHSLAIVAGAKFQTKEPLIEMLVSHYDPILLGGALGNDALKSRGLPIGASLVSDVSVPVELAQDQKLIVPIDAVLHNGSETRESYISDVRMHERIVDIGSKTIAVWSEYIGRTPFVLWNGPLGVYEEGFSRGTLAIGEALAHSGVQAIVGGGDTVAALERCTFDSSHIFLSTAGGAMLAFISQGTLPGIEALKKSSQAPL